MHSSSSLSIFLCFHFYHHCSPISHKVSSPQMPVLLLSLHFNSPPLSLCLSLSCSLVLSLISSAFVSSLDSVGSTHFPFFFIIRQLLYTLYLTIQPPPPPPPPQLQLHPSHSVFLFQPASRGRGVLIHLQARL